MHYNALSGAPMVDNEPREDGPASNTTAGAIQTVPSQQKKRKRNHRIETCRAPHIFTTAQQSCKHQDTNTFYSPPPNLGGIVQETQRRGYGTLQGILIEKAIYN